jgi:4'-phosphopantetheinyl transferase
MLHLRLIKLDNQFDYTKYLTWFTNSVIDRILSFHFEADRRRAFTSSLIKYYYLPQFFGISPNAIQIVTNAFGRPTLIGELAKYDFNISHSGDYVLVGITDQGRIGVDIEQINPKIEIAEISEMVFSPSEQQLVGNDLSRFYTMWSKKEAYLKASGKGFFEQYQNTSFNLAQIEKTSHSQIAYYSVIPNHYIAVCLLRN